MRLVSWNVNGIKTVSCYHPWINKRLDEILDAFDADIICFQEIKSVHSKLETDMIMPKGYHAFYSLPGRGYCGVGTFVRSNVQVVSVREGRFNLPKGFQEQGRSLITDHGSFVLINVYVPNDHSSPEKEAFKLAFLEAIEKETEQLLTSGRHVIVCGDLNIARLQMDHHDPSSFKKTYYRDIQSFEDLPIRKWMEHYLSDLEMTDTFRFFHPTAQKRYTVWNTFLNYRPANMGTRVDYFLTSQSLKPHLIGANLLTDILGSDHCPITLDLDADIKAMSLNESEQLDLTSKLYTHNWGTFPGKQQKIDLSSFKKAARQPTLEGDNQKTERQKTVAIVQKRISPSKVSKKKDVPITRFFQKKESTQQTALFKDLESDEKVDLVNLQMESVQSKATIEQAKQVWKQILKPPPIPKCRHNEDAVEMTVNKNGMNKGRKFYVCGRLADQRCDFFEWKRNIKRQTSANDNTSDVAHS
ncbi:Endonuclease/exonuclease/phosphatase [Gorgonomyces haynaldii]|nr:Endonuclease/exonuclease/phosphatase [Gorgonomyces haynaldii]